MNARIRSRLAGFALIGTVLAWLSLGAKAAEEKSPEPALRDLSQEVNALQTFYHLQLNPAQLAAIKTLALNTPDKSKGGEPAKASPKLRKAFIDLRAALVQNKDPDKIADLTEALDELEQTEKPTLNDEMDITEEARTEAPKLLKLLTPKQVAGYAGLLAEEITDPVERLQTALAKARGLEEKEWKQFRLDINDEIGRLLGGVDSDRADEFGNKAVQLLIVARGLSDDEFKSHRAELDKKIQEMMKGIGPTEVVRNVIEFRLAELLSNPRLHAALEARIKSK